MILKSTMKWLFICTLNKITDVIIRIYFVLVLINGTISQQSFHGLMDLRVIYQL